MANVCDSQHQHHVDWLAGFMDHALIAVYELKLHQEYYYTYYVQISLLLILAVSCILQSLCCNIHCTNCA